MSDKRRIAACIKALQGFSTDEIESGVLEAQFARIGFLEHLSDAALHLLNSPPVADRKDAVIAELVAKLKYVMTTRMFSTFIADEIDAAIARAELHD